MVVSHSTPAARPPKVHATYLSPAGRAAIAAHAATLKRRREAHTAAVHTQLALQRIARELRGAPVLL